MKRQTYIVYHHWLIQKHRIGICFHDFLYCVILYALGFSMISKAPFLATRQRHALDLALTACTEVAALIFLFTLLIWLFGLCAVRGFSNA